MGKRGLIAAAALLLITGAAAPALAGEIELSGYIGGELRVFPSSPAHSGQRGTALNPSLVAQPEFRYEWNDGNDRITIIPFGRLDTQDNERTHFDLREAVWLTAHDQWELRVGVNKVFWGVTESVHLVDIINQTDLVENPDGEQKLGQPMVFLSLPRDWGTIDLFVLPYFRERTFPGRSGRLRGALVVDTDRARFESGAKRHHIDVAARYSHTIDVLDFGVSYFRGTGRDPSFLPGADDRGRPVLVPFYQQIDQVSLDAQITTGAWLFKLEALYRAGQNDLLGHEKGYFASVVGFEYTFFGILGSNMDLGVVGEHLFDDRSDRALTPFENDVFFGLRLSANDVNDTMILAGIIQDIGSPARNFFVEASRRIGDSWTVEVESRFFTGAHRDEPLFDLRRDDLIQVELSYHF